MHLASTDFVPSFLFICSFFFSLSHDDPISSAHHHLHQDQVASSAFFTFFNFKLSIRSVFWWGYFSHFSILVALRTGRDSDIRIVTFIVYFSRMLACMSGLGVGVGVGVWCSSSSQPNVGKDEGNHAGEDQLLCPKAAAETRHRFYQESSGTPSSSQIDDWGLQMPIWADHGQHQTDPCLRWILRHASVNVSFGWDMLESSAWDWSICFSRFYLLLLGCLFKSCDSCSGSKGGTIKVRYFHFHAGWIQRCVFEVLLASHKRFPFFFFSCDLSRVDLRERSWIPIVMPLSRGV